MANPSVSYTFVNGNVADASQVNQNFTDLINSLTDGSKSLNIDALTAAGTATLNGAVNLGNATGDVITVNGSFAGTGGYYSETKPGILPVTLSDLDNASATRLGLKQYLHGTTYNGGNAPTVSASTNVINIGTVNRVVFVPYQCQDGAWRLKINITISGMTCASADSHRIAVNGVTFKNVTSFNQSLSATHYANSITPIGGYVIANSGTISIDTTVSTTPTSFAISGDIELESKPTWAY